MGRVGQRKPVTQRHVVAFVQDTLGYVYLGHWKDCDSNSKKTLFTGWLSR